jgi:hypothetical protein
MDTQYIYLLINPHKPGMLGVLGAFTKLHLAKHFAHQQGYTDKTVQLYRIKSNVLQNIMRCYRYENWSKTDVSHTLRKDTS